ncbi:hypothetical protein Lwal_0263 [Legionella waltersii]|uniref:Uncharacterized protein n=1 Tax=Legionella waltersii TaxID=66969 RepID=A0A0W1AN70_9GAMM|nr:hypothetical protein Lwal_0263 [Legionella waltersii]SNV01314.1 Uncharacterised protein [Legionella waltersii]
MALPKAVTLGSSIRRASVRLLTRAARLLRCCLNQILVKAGNEPSRARQQADTELSAFTNKDGDGPQWGPSPGLTSTLD